MPLVKPIAASAAMPFAGTIAANDQFTKMTIEPASADCDNSAERSQMGLRTQGTNWRESSRNMRSIEKGRCTKYAPAAAFRPGAARASSSGQTIFALL
jgi:hypothetical protein